MISIKYIVYKHYRRSDGMFPIKLRLTKNRESVYLDTMFTARSNQLSVDLSRIRDLKLERSVVNYACSLYDELNTNFERYNLLNAREIKDLLSNKTSVPDVVTYYESFIQRMIDDGREKSSRNYKSSLSRLVSYTSSRKLSFNEIDGCFLEGYRKYLSGCVGERGVELYMSCLRTIYNSALKEYNREGQREIKQSPFEEFSIPKSHTTSGYNLTLDQIRRMMSYQCSDSLEQLGIDVFFLSLFLCGINTIDIYKLGELVDGRIEYCRSKTRKKSRNGSFSSVSFPDVLLPILARNKGRNGKLFNFSERYKSCDYFNTAVGNGLRRVRSSLSIPQLRFYSARYSFATIARDIGISRDDIGLALVHSNNTTTDIYISIDYKKNDVTNAKVINYIMADMPYFSF